MAMSESGVFKTLDLISSFGLDRSSMNGSSETQNSMSESSETQNSMSESSETRSGKKRKNRGCDDRPKEKRREVVFSRTVEMPAALRNRIEALGGTDIQLVAQKQLQDTDLNKNHGRLSIPTKKLMNDFTTEEEKEELMQQEEDQNKKKKKNGMKVAIIDPELRESVIGLKLWKIGSCHNYCLVTQWNSFAQQNSLENGDYIQLWSFRSNNNALLADHHNQTVTSDLCFAIVKLDISRGIFNFI